MAPTANIHTLAQMVIAKASAKDILVVTAESCTGGMIAAALTDISGSSAVLDRAFITYSNEAKGEMLGVAPALIAAKGAVSAEVAKAMAEGALIASRAAIAVSVTGVAGPTGGTTEKPVGLVWFGAARSGLGKNQSRVEQRFFPAGGRDYVRINSVETALRLLLLEIDAVGTP